MSRWGLLVIILSLFFASEFSMSRIAAVVLFLSAFLPGAAFPAGTPFPQGASYEAGFSPNKGALDLVLNAIRKARSSINMAAYGFTSKPISAALLEAHKRGVKVALVADGKDTSGRYTAATFLANQGVPVRLNDRFAILHHKFMVIDGIHLQLGSFNYSGAAAHKNAENVLVLWNVKPLAATYLSEWQKLWDGGKNLSPNY